MDLWIGFLIVPRAIVEADNPPLWSVFLFTDPLPTHGSMYVLGFQRQWLAGISCGQDAAAGPWNVAAGACNAIANREVWSQAKAKAAMIRTLALKEDNRTKTVFEQLDSERRELLHSVCLALGCEHAHGKNSDSLQSGGPVSKGADLLFLAKSD